MLSLILIIFSGAVVGYLLRRVSLMKHIGVILNVIIILLLFFLGVSVGINEEVLNNFPVIGLDAFVLTFGGVMGTLLCAWWVYHKFFKSASK